MVLPNLLSNLHMLAARGLEFCTFSMLLFEGLGKGGGGEVFVEIVLVLIHGFGCHGFDLFFDLILSMDLICF